MAQPVFDDHPLEQYLREVGEDPKLMPGGAAEFLLAQEDCSDEPAFEDGIIHQETCPNFLKDIVQTIRSMISKQASSAFVERFKYNVISSSLLSSSILQPHNTQLPRLPGHHSRNSSLEPSETLQPIHSLSTDTQYYTFFLALALITILFGAGYYFASLLLFGISASLLYIWDPESSKHDMTPYLDTLDDLIAAGNVWDSVVQEAMTTLEKDETTTSTPSSPSSSLRVALHSTLLTTQNQCDDVRQLLSALTSHSELAQISEIRTISVPDPVDKRATWNGSYSFLAHAGSPSMQLTKRREKRRSDLSALLHATGSFNKSLSAPVTPSAEIPEQQLEGVLEEAEAANDADTSSKTENSSYDESQPFGRAALRLRRTRTIGGLYALRSSVSSPNSPPMKSPRSSDSLTGFPTRPQRSPKFATISSSSRFTAIQAPRHPLSFSSLNLALQNALASKRYACSHLLALRFAEERDDDAYWEDVKSVMMLLTSTLVDASARLTSALDVVDDQKLQDGTPSPSTDLRMSEMMSFSETARSSLLSRRGRTVQDSFAPMPSHLNRFASHIEAIASALEDARGQLVECVAALKSDPITGKDGSENSSNAGKDEHPALLAYERLRRELGLALRESFHELPALGHDGSDESSEKPYMSPLEYEVSSDPHDPVVVVNTTDDVTSHLLLTSSSHHLPPPGIEQVYEGDSGVAGAFRRERSKLSREERIQLAKKAKEDAEDRLPSRERWGPGGEVVQELKDVIWKVGERRRKMVDGQVHSVVPEALRVLD
ncbi:hypothetical protein BDP27DRAFT_1327344 [Rhodocollybia butyracea]|uniref:Myosin-binding domain-containing protein n=1 Tax=Rhodocollybia butyracea TaxID=206335 RepID=A0A9P5U748_9AGAR|nr:hypothetical protein BDP27DRAFT_1327344 [Rhodocollybia butyracea]